MEDHLRSFRRYSRVFPSVPYARHAPRVGCSIATDAKASSKSPSSKVHGSGSAVKIIALLCSKQHPQSSARATSPPASPFEPTGLSAPLGRKRPRSEGDTDEDTPCGEDDIVACNRARPSSPLRRTENASPSSALLLPQPEKTTTSSSNNSSGDATKDVVVDSSAQTSAAAAQEERTSHLYVRVQYDRALITTLPIEVMRKQHPQILIDYLLSMSVWA